MRENSASQQIGEEGQQAYLALARDYRLPEIYLAQQLWVLATAQVITEGLRRAGHDVSVHKLQEALQSAYTLTTVYGPDVNFSGNVGAVGGVVGGESRSGARITPLWQGI